MIYPVLQCVLRNKYQLLQFMLRSVACSLFRRSVVKWGSNRDIAVIRVRAVMSACVSVITFIHRPCRHMVYDLSCALYSKVLVFSSMSRCWMSVDVRNIWLFHRSMLRCHCTTFHPLINSRYGVKRDNVHANCIHL